MRKYPNMIVELFEAIHDAYVDYPEVEADTYLYFIGLKGVGSPIGQKAMEELNRMGRCYFCGNLLDTYVCDEENYTGKQEQIAYCPSCDVTFD